MTSEGPIDERGRRVDEAVGAYLEAVDHGNPPDPADWLARHPDLQPELAQFLADQSRLNRLVSPLRPPEIEGETTEGPRGFDDADAATADLSTLAWEDVVGPAVDPFLTIADPSSGRSDPAEPARGEKIRYFGDYRLLEKIGEGGMGVVYRAHQISLNRPVAVKMIRPGRFSGGEDLRRFQNEAEAVANLDHPNIVPILEVGEHRDRRYFSMKLIPGRSLAGRLADYAADPRDAALLMADVARAIHHAHQRGILHRDLKPGNVLVDAEGKPHVTDFGLAKRIEADSGLTQSGALLGTPSYMAPEQAEGSRGIVTTATDVYGLGATFYALLTGRPPFVGENVLATLELVRERAPEPPSRVNPRVGRDLETICLKCLEKDPRRRYDSAAGVANDLDRWLRGEPILARRTSAVERATKWAKRRPAAAALVAVSVLAVMSSIGLAVGLVYHTKLQRAFGREQLAHQNEVTARENERTIRYFNNMLMAEREWSNNNVARTEQLLNECNPGPGQDELRNWEWNYLKRQCHTEIRNLVDPPREYYNVDFSRDGRLVAARASGGDSIPIWNAETGELVRILTAGPDRGTSYGGLAFSPDGVLIASSSGFPFDPGQVKIWDVATGRELQNFSKVTGASSSVAFSPDGTRLAVAGGEMDRGSLLTVWDVESGKNLLTKPAPVSAMAWVSVAFSSDGNSLALASGKFDETNTDKRSGEVTILDSRTGEPVMAPLKGHKGPLTSVSYSPDGKHLASIGYDLMVRIWDAKTGEKTQEFRVASLRPLRVVFSPDSRRVATASDDNSARVWDATTGQELLALRGHTHEVTGVAFRGDGKRLATSCADHTVKIWNAETGMDALTLSHDSTWVNGVAFRPDGRQVVTACIDKKVRLFEVADGQLRQTFDDRFGAVWDVTFSPDGTLIASASGEWTRPKELGQVTIRNTATGEVKHKLRAHAGLVRKSVFRPDGKRLATAGGENSAESGVVKVWDLDTGLEILSCRGHTTGLIALAYSPDGRFLASAGWDNTVRLWDADTGVEVSRFQGFVGPIWKVAFDRDGTHIASVCEDATVRIWEVKTQTVVEFKGHKGSVRCLAYSPDGTRIATGGVDETIKIWNPSNGQEALTLRGHTGPLWDLAFSPDGHRIASASEDGTVKIWDGTPWDEPPEQAVGKAKPKEAR